MIKHILFDLDDTLYATSLGMMHEISARMNEYMITRVGIAPDDVTRARKDYWERYGTTLRGLYIERQIDPQDFLRFVHDVRIENYLRADARLDAMLTELPQSKAVFTNAPGDYARRVLRALGVAKHFGEIYDINFIEYQSKPTAFAYDKVIAALPVRADVCAMIDDTARNLLPAKQRGMRTIWLTSDGKDGNVEGVDAIVETVYDVARTVQDLDGF
jgi:putative hydrolase of the HAD superfamily